jgi:PAS domain S-box-containing protein
MRITLPAFWGRWFHPCTSTGSFMHREQWTQDVLSLMALVVLLAALIITGMTLAGWFTFADIYPVYALLALVLPAWLGARLGGWRWARLVPPALCFFLGAYGSYYSGYKSLFVLSYALVVLLAGMLFGSSSRWSMVAICTVSYWTLGQMRQGGPLLDYFSQPITFFFFMVGVATLQGYYDSRLGTALQELQEQETHLRRLAENTQDMVIETDPQGIIRYASPSHLAGIGYSPEILVGRSAYSLLLAEDVPTALAVAQQVALSAQPQRIELRARRADGQIIYIEVAGGALFDENGKLTGFQLASRDISARVQAAEELRLSEEKFATIFNLSPDVVNVNRVEDGVYLDINQAFTRVSGFTREEVIGRTGAQLNVWVNPGERARLMKELLKRGEIAKVELQVRRKDGSTFIGLISSRTITYNGEPCTLSIIHDITERARAEQELREAHGRLELAYAATLQGWARALEMRERETANHSRRVVELTLRMAFEAGITGIALEHVLRGALLHDIGKLGVPDAILLKPGPLTEEEWVIMRQHPTYARNLLSEIEYLRPCMDIPYAHHERWSGSGYPLGLKGDAIPLAARIFAIADVYDALTSDRPYRPAWPEAEALRYISEQAEKMFDPDLVKVFLAIVQ